MAEYKIQMVDEDEPRKWTSPQGNTVWYITVGLEGHPKPVSIGKKSPDALKVGDTVYGTIQPTDYLTDKWKPEAPPQGSTSSTGASGQSDNKFQRDVTAIPLDVWRTLIGIQGVPTNEVEFHTFFETVKLHADELLATIDKVRNGGSPASHPAETIKEESRSASTATSLNQGKPTTLKDNWAQIQSDKAVSYDDPPEEEG